MARRRSFRQRLPRSNGEGMRGKEFEVCYAGFMQSQVCVASCLAFEGKTKGFAVLGASLGSGRF